MSELGNVLKGIVENVKADVENVKEEVEHVKLQVKNFKNQVSSDMSKLVKVLEMMKTDSKDIGSKKDTSETARVDLFPCFRDIKNSFCLNNGTLVGQHRVIWIHIYFMLMFMLVMLE